MSQFRSVGGLDDQISDDGDRAFIGVNLRDQLNQLQPGEVRESLNGRMDGYWRPRKSVFNVSPPLTVGGQPLNLPFFILPSPYYRTITAVSYLDDLVTLTVPAHGLVIGEVGNILVSDITFTGTDYNGIVALTVVDANTLEFAVNGVTDAVLGATPRVTQININDTAAANVAASCLFSDSNSSNKEYIIVALETYAKKIDIATGDAVTINYPVGFTLNDKTEMLQLFNKVMIFRDGGQAFEWYPYGRPVFAASQVLTTVTMAVRSHGLTVGAVFNVSGLTGGTPANGSFIVTDIVSEDVFEYTHTTSQTQVFGVNDAVMSDGFTLAPAGEYTQPQTFKSEGQGVNSSAGVVSLEVVGNTTIKVGDIIIVYENEIPEFTQLLGNEYQVIFASTTLIEFYAPVGDLTGTGSTEQIQFGGRFSEGGGFMHQPCAPWGTYFQRRLWVPYLYEQSGAFDSPVCVTRNITDEVSASDILDTTTFDQIENQFRISGGTADFVVAMHGFYDDALIILNRNSLHTIANTQGSLGDTVVKELTNEVGCLARKSVIMHANAMLFLSDNGVYGLEFIDQYNLRGADQPLSKNIQPYIDRINVNLSDKSVARFYNNRYYLAVPLDSVAGAGDAIGNNSILIFNFLNKAWESLDTFGDNRFNIENLLVAGAGVNNNLYAVTDNGGLHQLEYADSSVDRLSLSNELEDIVTPTINSRLITRGYDLESMDRKRFTDVQIQMQNLAGETGEYSIEFSSEDPDNAQAIGTTTTFLGGEMLAPSTTGEAETANIRARLGGIRGYTGTVILTRTEGSPKIHSTRISASITNRQIISQK